MIPNPQIYTQDENQIVNDLLPPSKRKPVFKGFLQAIMQSTQYDHDLIFTDYANGSSADVWVSGSNYTYLQRVVYVDASVYECVNASGLTPSTIAPNVDTDNWIKVLDLWIGSRERVKYTGQLLVLEYILNKYFRVPPVALPWTGADHSTQIWISNNANGQTAFYLSNGGVGARTSYMANASANQKQFLGNAYSSGLNSFTIHVPTAVYNDILAIQPPGVSSADPAIRAIADKYVQAGLLYTIVTY